jgi:DNA polymerase-3 subunit beta
MRVTGTDLDVTVRTELEVEVLAGGTTVAPARLATEAVRKLPPGAVTLQAEGGEIEISGGGPVFRFREFSAADFPKLGEPALKGAVGVDGAAFVDAVSQVSVAASNDDARPVLTGVFFETEEGRLRLVATDSYRLAVRDVPAVEASLAGLVPVRALKELTRTVSAGKFQVAVGDREAAFASDRGVLTARLIEGSFPNYRQLIPASYPNRLTIARQALLEAIDRASLVAEITSIRIICRRAASNPASPPDGGETEHVESDYRARR